MPVAITGVPPQPGAAIASREVTSDDRLLPLVPLHAPLHGEYRLPHQLVSPDLPTSLTSPVPDLLSSASLGLK